MPRFAANLSMLFGEQSFLDRFGAAAEAGFQAVEYMFPYDHSPEDIRERLDAAGLEQVVFNLPAGDWEGGDRGIACDPSRVEEFREGVDRALEYAEALDTPRINCLAGLGLDDVSAEEQRDVLVQNLAYAAEKLEAAGRTLLLEAVNTDDIPGFFVSTTGDVAKLLDDVGSANLRIQYDFYHVQKMEGNLCERFDRLLDRIDHAQVADNPGRHQPGTGEINYPYVFEHIDGSDYDGWVGLEYVPEDDTRESLGWLERYGLGV